MKIEPNEPAFPIIKDGHIEYDGLTKKEYFAAMALGGMIGKKWGHVDGGDGYGNNQDAIECAALCVEYADCLIKALNR